MSERITMLSNADAKILRDARRQLAGMDGKCEHRKTLPCLECVRTRGTDFAEGFGDDLIRIVQHLDAQFSEFVEEMRR